MDKDVRKGVIRSYRDLVVWERSHELAKEVIKGVIVF